ncbi:MAG: glycosyltransferase family 39 protein [Acidobacteria bacterium]|nr:glycosyltransferase family 39 protein [Acidobacteriota bacterium]
MKATTFRNGRTGDWVLPGVAMAVYVGVGVWLLRFVFLSDFFQMIWIADAQRAWVPTAFANGFLGMGYPLTLNAVTQVTGNILTSGKLIQAASGAAILAMLPALTRGAFGDAAGSRLAQGLLAIDAVFFFAATGETPDLFATAFMVAGLLVATRYVRRPSVGAAIGVGVCLGLGYLVRYHSLLLLPLVMAVMFGLAPERRSTIWWVLGGFVLAAAPQLVASGVVQGNPLYNLHIKSVSMGYYGVGSDFVEKTRSYTLVRVLTENPAAVIKQYSIFVIRYFTEIGGAMLLLAGAILAKRREARGWAVLALPAIALTFLLAAKFYTDRAILFQLVMWYVVVGRVLVQLAAPSESRYSKAIVVALALALSASSLVDAGRTWGRMTRLKVRNDEITAVLRSHRIERSRQVFTTHLSYYLADDPAGGAFYPHDTWLLYDENYAKAFPHSYLTDLASLDRFVQEHHVRFLLLGPLTAELSPTIDTAQRAGDLGPGYTLLRRWPDLVLFERTQAARDDQ